MISDRVKENLERFVRGVFPLIDYQAMYRARVVSQSSDKKTVDVVPLNPKIPGLTAPLVNFGPTVTVTVPSGANCLIGWDGGDPRSPYAMTFYSASGSKEIARNGDAVKVTIPIGTFLTAAMAGVLNTSPVDVNGTIQQGSPQFKID